MANVQIPSLPLTVGLSGVEEFETVQNGSSYRTTASQIAALAVGSVTLPQTANLVFAGPASGAAAAPTFRALVNADMPLSGVTPGSYGDAANVPAFTVDDNGFVTAAANVPITATVFSVGLAAPSEFTVTGSPVTSSGTLTFSWANPVTVAHGGTGLASYTVGDLIYASGATTLAKLADVTTGNALISGGVGVAPSWGKIGLTTHITGTLGVGNGGTGLTAGTSGGVLAYTATGTIASSAALGANQIVFGGGAGVVPSTGLGLGTTTTVLHGNAAGLPTWAAVSLTADISGVLPVASGGTNISSYTIGDLVYASASGVLSKLADVATGNALISGGVGVAPTWGKIGLTTHVSGTLPIANGGTGITNDPNVVEISFTIDGGGAVISTGIKGDLQIPFNCTINSWTLLADQSGSAVVDIWKDTFANYPPTIADVITASAKPTLTAQAAATSSTLTGWTTTITAGDTLRINVNSNATCTRITLGLKATRT